MKRCILALIVSMAAIFAVDAQNELRIRPSKVNERLRVKLEADPKISPRALANLGNKLAETAGYSFDFAPEFADSEVQSGRPVKYRLLGANGRDAIFVAPEPRDHPCGIITTFPITAATPKSLFIIVDGRQLEMMMPKSFTVDEVKLVDASLRRTLRTWVVPMDLVPEAISRDGTKIYMNTFTEKLFIEIDQLGRYRYVARDPATMLINGVDLKKFPKEEDNDYLGFRRFKSGKKTYTLKFSHPCT